MPDSPFDLQKVVSAGIMPIMQELVKEGSNLADLHELGLAMLQCLARGQLVIGRSELDYGWWLSASSLFTKMHTVWQLFGEVLNTVQYCCTISASLQQQLTAQCWPHWNNEVVFRGGVCSTAPIL